MSTKANFASVRFFCLVRIRSLTAVLLTSELVPSFKDRFENAEMFPSSEKQAIQDKFTRLKQQHVEYYLFDVFIAHNSKDKSFIKQISDRLQEMNLRTWLDDEEIPPGRSFQAVIQQTIRQIKTTAIFIGPEGLGPWQTVEQESFLAECVERNIPVIPVLLPGVAKIPDELVFLKRFRTVAFETENDEAALDRLRWGITGNKR